MTFARVIPILLMAFFISFAFVNEMVPSPRKFERDSSDE